MLDTSKSSDALSMEYFTKKYGKAAFRKAFIEQPGRNILFPYLYGNGGMNLAAAGISYKNRLQVEKPYQALVEWASDNFKWELIMGFGQFLEVILADERSTRIHFKITVTERAWFPS